MQYPWVLPSQLLTIQPGRKQQLLFPAQLIAIQQCSACMVCYSANQAPWIELQRHLCKVRGNAHINMHG